MCTSTFKRNFISFPCTLREYQLKNTERQTQVLTAPKFSQQFER